MSAIDNSTHVRGLLALAGYRSIEDWAKAHGYKAGTVRRVVYDWWHRGDREPLGGIGRQIMRDLRQTIERGAA